MPNTPRSPADVRRSAQAAPYEDGLLELLMAALFLGIAAVWSAGRGELLGLLALPIILAGGVALARLKQRYSEPRIGYVRPHADDPSPPWHWVAFVGGGVLLLAVAVILTGEFSDSESWVRWAPLVSGYLIAGAFRYLATTSGLRRYVVLAVASLLVGAAVGIASDGSSYDPMAVYFLAMAGMTAATGAVALARFVRSHPRVDDRTGDERDPH